MSHVEQNGTADKPFPWSKTSEKAVVLVAEDTATDAEIADACKIGRTTLHRWKQHPEFEAKRRALVAEFGERARSQGIARLDKRQAAYNDRHTRMTRLLAARAKAMDHLVDGGDTGLLVQQVKSIGGGDNAREVEEYHFDAALMKELRELEKQAAQDAGDWSEKREVSGPGGGPIPITTVEVATADEDDT